MLIAAVMISGAAMAQSPVKFGLKVGGNFANNTQSVSGNGLSLSASFSSITSFYAGGFVTLPIGAKSAFQPELLVSSQGAKMDEVKTNTLYLNIPLMFKYNVVAGLHAEAGPQVGYLLSAKAKYNGDSQDIKDGYKSLDFGLNVGAEYQFPIGLSLNARYNFGLANISKSDEGEDLGYTSKVKNTVFSLGLGYRF